MREKTPGEVLERLYEILEMNGLGVRYAAAFLVYSAMVLCDFDDDTFEATVDDANRMITVFERAAYEERAEN